MSRPQCICFYQTSLPASDKLHYSFQTMCIMNRPQHIRRRPAYLCDYNEELLVHQFIRCPLRHCVGFVPFEIDYNVMFRSFWTNITYQCEFLGKKTVYGLQFMDLQFMLIIIMIMVRKKLKEVTSILNIEVCKHILFPKWIV